ncbi:MAG: hypothetical protein IJI45_08580 [Anaerolineaceae bacterium]|nr:hypothetical protein [Anaerolineaceae bacterium]
MALIDMEDYSRTVDLISQVSVILPLDDGSEPLPVLWLLPDYAESERDWYRFTNVERYAQENGVAVVMMHGWMSYYCDMTWGPNFYKYISQELVENMRYCFTRLSHDKKDNHIAGYMLGGQGALEIGIRNPDKYASITLLSCGGTIPGLSPVKKIYPPAGGPEKMSVNKVNYGVDDVDEAVGTQYDLAKRIRELDVPPCDLPAVFHVASGAEETFPNDLALKAFLEGTLGLDGKYSYTAVSELSGWDYRDLWIRKTIERIAAKRRDV